MSIFVRFFDIENKISKYSLKKNLLALLTFKGKTRKKDLFKSFNDDFIEKIKSDL